MENLKLYYYVNVDSSNQIFAEVEVNNFSEIKVKNALAKKAVEIFISKFSKEELNKVTKEDIKKLKKSFKKNTFDTCHLDENKNLIEVTGNFTKDIIKTESIEIYIGKDGYKKTIEAIKVNSKVLNNVYIYKDGKHYNVSYKGFKLFETTNKNIKEIDKKINEIGIDTIEKNIDNMLVELNIIAPHTAEQLEKYLNKLNEEKKILVDVIENRSKRNRNSDLFINELNAIISEIKLVNKLLNKENKLNDNIDINNNTTKSYIVKDTKNNREFKPELIGKMFDGVVSGEYIGLQVDNNTIWILQSEVMEVNTSNTSNIEKEIKQSKIKINMLNHKINRLLDKRDIIKAEAIKQKIRLNDKTNTLIQQLFKLDYETDIIYNRIDRLRVYINGLKGILYNISLEQLKAEYGANKYKITNRFNGDIIYSNNIDNYINNFNYNIKVLINNVEYVKQQYYPKNTSHKHYFCDTVSYLNDSLKVIYYDKNDTLAKINKYYHLDWNKNILLIEETFKKNHTRVHCMQCIAGSYVSINYLSINKISDELYNNTMKLFIDNKTVTNMLKDAYNKHKEYLKNYRQPSFNEKKEIYINHYKKIIDQFPKLKKVAENLKYYSDLYSNNIYKFYRDFKTNSVNFNNYLYNYNELNRLLNLNNNCKEYNFDSPKKVVYTKNYRNTKAYI